VSDVQPNRRRVARTALACLAPVLAGLGGLVLAAARSDGPDGPDVEAAVGASLMRPVGVARTDAGRQLRLVLPRFPRQPAEVAAEDDRLLTALGYAGRVARTGPPTEATNCAGWVFTGGRFWVEPEDAERVLADNGYRPVADPRPGDLAVYRRGGALAHAAVVREAGADRAAAIVEGKWGWMGVFRHPAGDCCYGPDYTFYRSPRRGHLLAGLPPPEPDQSVPDSPAGEAARALAN
jgi:hypothetical protein